MREGIHEEITGEFGKILNRRNKKTNHLVGISGYSKCTPIHIDGIHEELWGDF